jgi:hypothetical protein
VTPKQQEVAELLAHGKSVAKTAELAGVGKRTIFEWKKKDAAFQAEIERIWRHLAQTGGMSDQDLRLRSLNDLDKRLTSVMVQRAKDPGMQTVPGGNTGLMTVRYKMLSRMDNTGEKPVRVSEPVPEYAVDTGMIAELRAVKLQIAIETGQWKPKHVVERRAVAAEDSPAAVALSKVMTAEQLEELEQKLLALSAGSKE